MSARHHKQHRSSRSVSSEDPGPDQNFRLTGPLGDPGRSKAPAGLDLFVATIRSQGDDQTRHHALDNAVARADADRELPDRCARIFRRIARNCHGVHRYCWEKFDTIARLSGQSQKSVVSRAVRLLVEGGYLVRIEVARPGFGGRHVFLAVSCTTADRANTVDSMLRSQRDDELQVAERTPETRLDLAASAVGDDGIIEEASCCFGNFALEASCHWSNLERQQVAPVATSKLQELAEQVAAVATPKSARSIASVECSKSSVARATGTDAPDDVIDDSWIGDQSASEIAPDQIPQPPLLEFEEVPDGEYWGSPSEQPPEVDVLPPYPALDLPPVENEAHAKQLIWGPIRIWLGGVTRLADAELRTQLGKMRQGSTDQQIVAAALAAAREAAIDPLNFMRAVLGPKSRHGKQRWVSPEEAANIFNF